MPNAQFPVHAGQSARLSSLDGIRIREDTLFTDHQGREKRGVRKRAEKTIAALRGVLSRVLSPEETVLYVARGRGSVGALAHFAVGWSAYHEAATVLVFTNDRLLSIAASEGVLHRQIQWRGRLRSAKWGDIEGTKISGLVTQSLQLRYRNGERESFHQLRFGDAKKIKVLLAAVESAGGRETNSALSMVALCPTCMATLTPLFYHCNKCEQAFKDERTLFRRLFIPGGAYFYVGHGITGIVHVLVDLEFLFLLVAFALAATGLADPLAEPGRPTDPGEALSIAAFLAIVLGLEKMIEALYCRRLVRQFIPAK